MTQAERDCMTLALRLLGEDPATFAPETAEVMDRWRPRVLDVLAVEGIPLKGGENHGRDTL